MPPLTIDADGWFTVVKDAPSPPKTPPPVEKVQPQDVPLPVSPLQWNRRPSIGPARKRNPSAARSPSGWIIGVDDVRREDDASERVDGRVVDASGTSSDPSDVQVKDETKRSTRPRRVSIAVMTCGKEETDLTLVNRPSSNPSSPKSISFILEPQLRSGSKEKDTQNQSSSAGIATIEEAQNEDVAVPSTPLDPQGEKLAADDVSTASSSSSTSSNAGTSITSTESIDDLSHDVEKATDTVQATTKEAAETASVASGASTSTGSSAVASTSSSSSDTPKKLRPRARSSPQPVPTLGMDPKVLVGKVLTHIRRSGDHPTVTLYFADGTTYQILVDGYDPRNSSATKPESNSTSPSPSTTTSPSPSRSCVLEMDEVLLRMLEVPGRHVVDRTIADCAHIRLADKAYERREWEQSWTQTHVAVAFKFVEESRWHCVWAMRAEYDERGCIFRAFDDVYLQVLDRQYPRSPQRKFESRRQGVPSPLKTTPGRIDTSSGTLRSLPKPPPSPTATRSKRSPSKTPKKAGLLTARLGLGSNLGIGQARAE